LSPKDFDKDFGHANFVEGKNNALVMEWQSKKYQGKMFYFHIANRYPNGNQALRCRSCSNLKHVHSEFLKRLFRCGPSDVQSDK
jgi:hypothetical protein